MDKSKATADVYTKIAEVYTKTFNRRSYCLNHFAKLLKPGSSILDVGCGSGIDARFLTKLGFKVTGVDLSVGMIEYAKMICPQGNFSVGDARKLGFANNSFDSIVAAWVLHHLPRRDSKKFLADLFRIVKPGGFVFLSTQEGIDDEHEDPEPFMPSENMLKNIMSEKSVIGIAEKLGFKVIDRYCRKAKSQKSEEFPYNKLVLFLKK